MIKPYLSIIIPAYNEADRLPLTLIDIDKELEKAEYSYEIIVVNDGSKDKTGEIGTRLASIIPHLKVVSLEKNTGKGGAMRAGNLSAHGNWRLFTDADNSINISEFEKAIPFFSDGYEIVIASRIKGSRIRNFPILRRLAEMKINLFTKVFLKSKIKDFLLGFQIYSENTANYLFDRIKCNGADAMIEALFLAEKAGFRIAEFPAVVQHKTGSKFRFSSYFGFFWSIIKMKIRYTRGGYGLEKTSEDS
jgi:dolichyl-phosphate beta-glucosyltransferase